MAMLTACCALCCAMLCAVLQLPVLRRIIADEGMSTIWRGMKPRVLFNAPAAAVSWGTYETVKGLLLGDRDGQQHHFSHH